MHGSWRMQGYKVERTRGCIVRWKINEDRWTDAAEEPADKNGCGPRKTDADMESMRVIGH